MVTHCMSSRDATHLRVGLILNGSLTPRSVPDPCGRPRPAAAGARAGADCFQRILEAETGSGHPPWRFELGGVGCTPGAQPSERESRRLDQDESHSPTCASDGAGSRLVPYPRVTPAGFGGLSANNEEEGGWLPPAIPGPDGHDRGSKVTHASSKYSGGRLIDEQRPPTTSVLRSAAPGSDGRSRPAMTRRQAGHKHWWTAAQEAHRNYVDRAAARPYSRRQPAGTGGGRKRCVPAR